MGHRSLVAIATYNSLSLTEQCVASLSGQDVELLMVDDCSSERIDDLAGRLGIAMIKKESPAGLTDSWNRAYQYFLAGDYDFLFVSNNDVLVPPSALRSMQKKLERHPLVCAMTRPGDLPDLYPAQSITRYYPVLPDCNPDLPEHYQLVQSTIDSFNRTETADVLENKFYGFFFGVSKAYQAYEFAPGLLVDPSCINIGQEIDLLSRVGEICVDDTAFIFHFGGMSFGKIAGYAGHRENKFRYHPGLALRHPIECIRAFANELIGLAKYRSGELRVRLALRSRLKLR